MMFPKFIIYNYCGARGSPPYLAQRGRRYRSVKPAQIQKDRIMPEASAKQSLSHLIVSGIIQAGEYLNVTVNTLLIKVGIDWRRALPT